MRTWDYIKIQKSTIDALKSAIDEENIPRQMIVYFDRNPDNNQWVCIYAQYNEVA